MTIRVKCGNCGQEIGFEEKLLGRQGRCPVCKEQVLIRPAGAEAPEPPPEKEPQAKKEEAAEGESSSYFQVLVVVIIVLLALIVMRLILGGPDAAKYAATHRETIGLLDEGLDLKSTNQHEMAAAKFRDAFDRAEELPDSFIDGELAAKLKQARAFMARRGEHEVAEKVSAEPSQPLSRRIGMALLLLSGGGAMFIVLWAISELLFVVLALESHLRPRSERRPEAWAIVALCVLLRTVALVQLVTAVGLAFSMFL